MEIVCWDISEDERSGSMSEELLSSGFDGIIFVVDSTKKENLKKDGLLMRQFISSPGMLHLPLLIFINKSDSQGVGFWEVSMDIGVSYI